MPVNPCSDKIYFQASYRSPEKEGSLRTIDVCGIPSDVSKNGRCEVTEKILFTVDELIPRRIFRNSQDIKCEFEYIKIWLCDTKVPDEERGYEIPRIDNQDIHMHSRVWSSRLEYIYILDNGLKGREYEIWKKAAEDLFRPLFNSFGFNIPVPQPVDLIKNISLVKNIMGMLEELEEKFDTNLKNKDDLLSRFNALIVQID